MPVDLLHCQAKAKESATSPFSSKSPNLYSITDSHQNALSPYSLVFSQKFILFLLCECVRIFGEFDVSVSSDYYCYYSRDPSRSPFNAVVTEDLRDGGFRAIRPDLCGVVYMRAQMRALAKVHATSFAFVEEECGGRGGFLKRSGEVVREKRVPALKPLKVSNVNYAS